MAQMLGHQWVQVWILADNFLKSYILISHFILE